MKTFILLAFVPVFALAQVPVTMQAGQPARAADVNQNFTNLDTRTNTLAARANTLEAAALVLAGAVDSSLGTLIISGVAVSDLSGVAGALCPADRIAISANCHCDNVNGARNLGVLFSCQVAGNGAVVGCFHEVATYTPTKPSPRATVVVGCISARTNAGTPLPPTPIIVKGGQPSSPIVNALNATDEFEVAVQVTRDQVADQLVSIQQQ